MTTVTKNYSTLTPAFVVVLLHVRTISSLFCATALAEYIFLDSEATALDLWTSFSKH